MEWWQLIVNWNIINKWKEIVIKWKRIWKYHLRSVAQSFQGPVSYPEFPSILQSLATYTAPWILSYRTWWDQRPTPLNIFHRNSNSRGISFCCNSISGLYIATKHSAYATHHVCISLQQLASRNWIRAKWTFHVSELGWPEPEWAGPQTRNGADRTICSCLETSHSCQGQTGLGQYHALYHAGWYHGLYFNIKVVFLTTDLNHKNKMVMKPSYFYHGSSHTGIFISKCFSRFCFNIKKKMS